MSEKPIDWRGSSLRDIKDDDIFTPNAHDKDITAARYKAVIQERSKK